MPRQSSVPPKKIQGNPIFEKFARYVLRIRWVLLLCILGVTLFMGKSIADKLRWEVTMERFLSTQDKTSVSLEKLRDTFGQDLMFLVLVEGDVFSMNYLKRLKSLHERLAALDLEIETLGQRRSRSATQKAEIQDFKDDDGWGDEAKGTIVERITSLVNVRQTRALEDGIVVKGFLDEWPKESELKALKKRAMADKNLVGNYVSKNGKYSVIAILTDFMSEKDMGRVNDAIVSIANEHREPGFEIMVTGVSDVNQSVLNLISSAQGTTTILASLIVIVFLVIMFKHPIGVFAPLMVVWLADIWTLGIMSLVDVPLSSTTSLLTAFIACIGIADAVHIQSAYRDCRAKGMSNEKSIVDAIATTGVPVFFTSLTTAIGLLSLTLADIGGISEMGAFSAVGIGFAFVLTLVLLPIELSFNKKSLLGIKPESEKSRFIDRVFEICSGLSRPLNRDGHYSFRRRNITLAVIALLFIVSVAGALQVRLYHDSLDTLPKNHPSRIALDTFENYVGGTSNVALMIEAPDGKDLRDKDILESMERLETYLLAYDDGSGEKTVRFVTSMLDPIRESFSAFHGESDAYYKLPDTKRGISDMITLFENAAPDELKTLVTLDMKKAVMLARIKWLDALATIPLARYIDKGVAKIVGDKAIVQATGTVYVVMRIFSLMFLDLFSSFGTAILVISVVMLLLLRDFKLGLMAMLPNLFPILVVLGLMGLASIPIDLNTLLVGPLAIGIVVDDTIHFLHQFKSHYLQNQDMEQALSHTFSQSGRAIVITSLILGFSFLANLATDIQSFQTFGLLLSLTIFLALVADLVLCPALLRFLYGQKQDELVSVKANQERYA